MAEDARGYTLREAGDRLGISTRQARRYVLDGRLDAVLVPGPHGAEYRIAGESVDRLATARSSRESGRTAARAARAPSPLPDTIRPLSAALSDHLAALERAWSRIADLEAENARLRALLPAPGAASETAENVKISETTEAPSRPPASRAAETRRGLRAAWRRWRG